MPREWDAKTYDSLPQPHKVWSQRTLQHITLDGHETVLDAGAGTGRDIAVLLDRLPAGRVVAVDGSTKMLEKLRANLDGQLDRVDIVNADLTKPLPIDRPVDAVFSVATFHWIHDHPTLFANIAQVLRLGGQFVAECGGQGCVARVLGAVEEVLGQPADAAYFAGTEETAERLAQTGFTDIEVSLLDDPARLEPGEQLRSYLGTMVLGPYLDRLSKSEHRQFVQEVAARMAEPVIDYVRLNIRARRAS
ncbi:trans-aconitate 2-methyltransferase [Streptomyces mirabilis]|uniref:Methyltransferase domain-containing protein n=1 Tax=Streptomyces mirabilis TaxID=68239 RepID=A0ABU3V604_9ACTN|nr:class I SAM-dependent methyltransferase [Streptomyces mirabilis]MCX5357056.1 methyltransferase domain-containing protein [Streptomyces mirabilis]MDU9001593.1 methyltransferase domain-containing protein [Streptomyces mirabilis]